MQPEITREWLAEQLALCERVERAFAVLDDPESLDLQGAQAEDEVRDSGWQAAARTGYPLLLRKAIEASDSTAIIAMLKTKTMDERKAFFDLLANEFCMACGSDNPRCQCWNDE